MLSIDSLQTETSQPKQPQLEFFSLSIELTQILQIKAFFNKLISFIGTLYRFSNIMLAE